jgi:hypothetical protein
MTEQDPTAPDPQPEDPAAAETAQAPEAPQAHAVSDLLEDDVLMAAIAPAAPTTGGTGPKGKVRSPVGSWFLVLITLGIYGLFWYYNTNRELRDYDSRIVVSPGLAVLALLVPIVNWFSVYNTGKRIRQAQQIAGVPVTASGGIGVLLTFVFGFWVPYYVSQVNGPWESGGA